MAGRALGKKAAGRKETDTEELIELITGVVTELFGELLVESLKDPDVRAAVMRSLMVARRTGTPPPRAAAVKAARRR